MAQSVERQTNPILKNSFVLLQIFLFFIFSGVMEITPVLPKLRPQLIMAIFGLLAVVGSGQFFKIIRTPIGICITVFTAWFIACIPFGAWPGGSFHEFIEVWYKSALIYFLTAGLLTTLPQANRLFRTIAYAIGILGILTLLKNNRTSDGRLVLDNTRYANANDLAFTLVLGLVFVGVLFLRGNRAQKTIALLITPPILMTISRTGSRAVSIGVGVLVVAALIQSTRATRRRMLAVLPFVFLAVIVLLPKDILMRYTTFFGTYDPYNTSATEKLRMSTIESTESRKQLLIDSLIVTMRHPFLGVGPANFQVAQKDLADARGERANWHVTHNTYTQLSSEMGIPGLVIFLALLYYVFKTLNSVIRSPNPGPRWENLRQLALALRAAFIVFVPVVFFGSFAYNSEVPIFAGLTTAIGFMAQKQRAIDRAAAAPVTEELVPTDANLEPVAVGQY